MNNTDILIVFLAFIFALFGYFKGFIIGIIELIGLITAYFVSTIAYKNDIGFLSKWINNSDVLRKVIESIIIFYAVIIIFAIIKRIIKATLLKEKGKLRSKDKFAGLFLGVLKCSLFVFIFSILYYIIPKANIPKKIKNNIDHSIIISFFKKNKPEIVDKYVDKIKEKVSKLEKLKEASKDPEKMEKLKDDPAVKEFVNSNTVQALQNDPDIKNAIKNKDFSSLLSNPKIQALMQTNDVQKLLKNIDIDKVLNEK